MFVELAAYVGRLEELVDPGIGIPQELVHVVDAFAAEPAGVGSAEALFHPLGDVRRYNPLHRLAEDQLAVAVLEFVTLPSAHVVFVHPVLHAVEIADLVLGRYPEREVDQIVVEERDTRLQAVERQLVSDVPIASYLSGGMDSGSITAVASRRLGRMMTFTMGFDLSSASGLELGFDERAKSEALSNLLKTEHYEMVLHAGDMEHAMPDMVWHLEDLRVGQSYPNYYVARLAGKFAKVVLAGTGGDELFGGYPWRYYRGLNSTCPETYHRNHYAFWQRLVSDEEKRDLFRPEVAGTLDARTPYDIFKGVLEPVGLPLRTNRDFVDASLCLSLIHI